MENSNSYSPLDISSIQKASINSDRELEVEVSKICETLKDTQSHDWKKRTESLKKVQELSVLFLDIVEGESNISPQFYLNLVLKLYQPLTAQRFSEEMKGSKNTWVHGKIANFLSIMLEIYPFDTFERQVPILEQYMTQCITDANPEARQKGRRAFLLWQKHAPQAADQLFRILDYSVQRAIYDEKDSFLTTDTTQSTKTSNSMSMNSSTFTQKAQSVKITKQPVQQEEVKDTRAISQTRPKTAVQENVQRQKTPLKGRQQKQQNTMSPINQRSGSRQNGRVESSQGNKQKNPQAVNPPQVKKQNYLNPFTANEVNSQMDIDDEPFSFDRAFINLKSPHWHMKVKGLEDLLSTLVDYRSEQLLKLYEREKVFPLIVNYFLSNLEQENVHKVLEVSMDFLELLLTSLPESLFDHIEQLIACLLKLLQNKKDTIHQKANDLLNLAQEILSADVLLPHLVGLLTAISQESIHLATKISALEVLNILIKRAENLSEEVQYESITQVIGSILQCHSTHKGIQMPSLGALLALRDQNKEMTLEAITALPQMQVNIIRQLANAYERTLAKQISETMTQTSKAQELHKPHVMEIQVKETKQIQSILDIIQSNDKQTVKLPQQVLSNQTNRQQQQPDSKSASYQIPHSINKENQVKHQKSVPITTLNQFTPATSIISHSDLTNPLSPSKSPLSQQLINCYQQLMDAKIPIQAKLQSLKTLQKLSISYSAQQEDAWSATFESIFDSLITILQNPTESLQLKEFSYDILKTLITSQPRERLSQLSKRVSNTALREKIIKIILQIYVSTIPVQSSGSAQCQTNLPAEEVLEAVLMKSDIRFLCHSVGQILRQEQPPKLQALLKVITTRIRAVNQGVIDNEFKYESYQQIVEALLGMVEVLVEVINNQNADVRKCCVFCLVEIQGIIGDELFAQFSQKLNPSQQKLVDIYIKRKQDLIKQEALGTTNYGNNNFQRALF